MPIASLPIDPVALRSVRLSIELDTRKATGIRPADNYRTPVRDSAGRFLRFDWFTS